jgi:hypothetical protein
MENKDIFDNEWERDDAPQEDFASIKKMIKAHDRKTIAKALALIIALVLFIALIVIPLTEKLYWNPEMYHYEANVSDLQLTLSAWTELFYPGKQVTGIQYSKTGFASYDLRIAIQDHGKEAWEKVDAILERNKLYLDPDFYEIDPRDVVPFRQLYAYEQELELETLQKLPEYVTIRAAVTLPEELDMAQVFAFWQDYTWSDAPYPLYLDWVAVRTSNSEEYQKTTGFAMHHYGPMTDASINDHYPELRIESLNPDGKYLVQHFKSLLKYSSDQLEAGRGMNLIPGVNYYKEVLEYVEENGVKSYGFIVSGAPQALLHLLEEGIITQINILDGWLDVE